MSLRRGALAVALALALVGYTRLIWMSGFDQGSAVAMCVVASIQNDGKLASDFGACKDAKAYERNPLWLLRRRGVAQ